MFNESALIKYDKSIVSLSRGKPAVVEFDWMSLYELKLSLKGDFNPDLVSFYHVHPRNFLTYSALDVECLKGFNLALGFPVFFGIIVFDKPDFYDLRYSEVAYRLVDNEMRGIPNHERHDLRLSMWDAILLKGASYSVIVED